MGEKKTTKKKKVLLVEDEKALASALTTKLEADGVEVLVCSDGASAVECIVANPEHLVVLDIILPNVNGFEILQEVQSGKKRSPILIWSNLEQEEDIQRAKDIGADEYLFKTEVSLIDLVDYIHKYL
ncbi:MAG: response regulator [Candidatus Jacksonbacteria bacterium]|jgi:DNA-binding response OmpR family regulator|nr:response regulator [Candidatus Jacksonbacteria bacterium]MBT6034381.1 response regulator [Candidatus Jacksonbacteria bacterium]MBT6301411.1 response regulator [Candidatus Jacksonbacteria bacterium]MBT6756804.1 response regulator [Candidatus Jacksonbacteria bacterium]MBT6954727.1 response regulator [Candidatus Jacksonbacteria bacterium]